MGVPGLWELLRPAVKRTSLSALSKEAFYANNHGLRALTVGIDASIWIFHAQGTFHGENPFLRIIFFKITALLQHPVLPVFVFDGPNKPNQKRNQNVAGQFGTADHNSKQFKALLDVCGLEWWNAPGEAEAELAVMNRQGKIDAVLSDDVDALVFGATCLLRNNSPTLSGATGNNLARGDVRNYEVYRPSAIREKWAEKDGTKLLSEEDCRMAMVLIALLGGGDYTPEGLPNFGPAISFGLANAGLSDFLKTYTTDRATFNNNLPDIHERIINELRTNAAGQVGRRYPARAKELEAISPTSVFPSSTLDAYLKPTASPLHDPSDGWPGFGKGAPSRGRGMARNEGRGDMEGLARACERYFEWGTKDLVTKKFAGESVGVFGAELMNEAREAVRARRSTSTNLASPPLIHQTVGTSQAASSSRITSFFQHAMPSSSPIPMKSSQMSQPMPSQRPQQSASNRGEPPSHVVRIHSVRTDPTDSSLNEYRIAYRPGGYVQRCHAAMDGTRSDPTDLSDDTRQRLELRGRGDADDRDVPAAPADAGKSKDEIRVWMAEYLVREAWPGLVQRWEDEQTAKANKSPKKKATRLPKGTTAKSNKAAAKGMDTAAFAAFFGQGATQRRRSTSDRTEAEPDEEVEEIEWLPPRSRAGTGDLSMSDAPAAPAAGKKARARPCPTSSLSSLPESNAESARASPARTRARPKAKTTRTSSPRRSSPESDAEPVSEASAMATRPPNALTKARLTSPTRKRATSPKRGWPFTRRIFSKSKSSPSALASPATSRGKKDQPIDLCSSDSDSEFDFGLDADTPIKAKPKPRARRKSSSKEPVFVSSSPVLAPVESENDTPMPAIKTRARTNSRRIISSPTSAPVDVLLDSRRANTLSPAPEPDGTPTIRSKSTKTRSQSKSKSKACNASSGSGQDMLSFPVVGSSQASQSKDDGTQRQARSLSAQVQPSLFETGVATIKTAKSGTKPSSPRKKKLQYVVVSETSDEEVIDCTRRR